jgi:DNA-binding MarR family transcriptional regulator
VTSYSVTDIMTVLNHNDNILSKRTIEISNTYDTDPHAEEVDRLVADVLECAGALRRYGDALTRPLGQTEVRWAVLSVLSGGARTVPQVARRLGVTRQSVQRVANLLAAEGLIESVTNPDNSRSPLFRLSKRGEEVLTAITRAADPWLRRVGEELSLEDLRRARAALAVLMRFARGPNVR